MKISAVSPEIPQGPLVVVRAPAKPVEVKASFEVGDWPVPNAAAQELSGASSNEDTRDSSRPVAAAPNPAGLKEGWWHVFDSSKPCPDIPEGVYSLKYTDGTGSDGWHASTIVSNWEGGATHIAAFRIIKPAPTGEWVAHDGSKGRPVPLGKAFEYKRQGFELTLHAGGDDRYDFSGCTFYRVKP